MSLVVDASAVADALLGTRRGRDVATQLGDHMLVAPGHLTAEVLSVLRGWTMAGLVGQERALTALHDFDQLGIELIDTTPLLADAYALRHNLSADDALYVVLARALGCRLLTLDARVANSAPDCT